MKARDLDSLPLHQFLTGQESKKVATLTREIQMEAAMCAWEAWLEFGMHDKVAWPEGAGQARLCCGALAAPIHIGWSIATHAHDAMSYDWEFVPWFLENCVIWDTEEAYVYGDPLLKPLWLDMCRGLNKPSKDELLRKTLTFLNQLPRKTEAGIDSYKLAREIEGALKNG